MFFEVVIFGSVVFFFFCSGSAQQVSFRITPVHPVQALRAEALSEQPPQEQGAFLKPDLVELVKLDPTIKLDIRYATTNNFVDTPYTPRREPSFSVQRRKPCFALTANLRLRDMV